MKVYLLRHAKAVAGSPDADRELAGRGRDHARALGKFLAGTKSFSPERLWRSPFVRAEQTAGLVQNHAKAQLAAEERGILEPDVDPAPLAEELKQVGPDLLIVGHNPNLEILASLLIAGERQRVRLRLKTCAIMCLDYNPIPNLGQLGVFELRWMVDPRLF